jgi:hypothetical protein
MRVLGAVLLAAPLIVIVGMTVAAVGWKGALCVWIFSIAMTATIVVGLGILTGAVH